MKKYYTDPLDWELIYVPVDVESNLSLVVKTIDGLWNVVPFHKENYTPATVDDTFSTPVVCEIKSDENMFEAETLDGMIEIWQVGAKATDMNGKIIPGLHKVRKVGFIEKC